MSVSAPQGQELFFEAYKSHREEVQGFAKASLAAIEKKAGSQKKAAQKEIPSFSSRVANLCDNVDAKKNAELITAFLRSEIQHSTTQVASRKADPRIIELFKKIIAGTWPNIEGKSKELAAAPKTPSKPPEAVMAPATPIAAPTTPTAVTAGAANSPPTPTTPEVAAFIADGEQQSAAMDAAMITAIQAAESALAAAASCKKAMKKAAGEIRNITGNGSGGTSN